MSLRTVVVCCLTVSALAGCTEGASVPRGEAVDAVLDTLDLHRTPTDLVADLDEDVPKRFRGVDRVWLVYSESENFRGWVDAETGVVLDVLIGASIDD